MIQRRRAKKKTAASAQNQPRRRHLLRLANCVHLKLYLLQRPEAIMQKLRSKLEFGGDGGVSSTSGLPFKRELSVLKRSRSLRDPAASPSCSAAATMAGMPLQVQQNSKHAEGQNALKRSTIATVTEADDEGDQKPCARSVAADRLEETEGESCSVKESWSTDVASPEQRSKQSVQVPLLRVQTMMTVEDEGNSSIDEEDDDDGNSSVVFLQRRKANSSGGGVRHPQQHLLLNTIKKLDVRRPQGFHGELAKRDLADGAMDSEERERISYGCAYTSRLRSRCRSSRRAAPHTSGLLHRSNNRGFMMKKATSSSNMSDGEEQNVSWGRAAVEAGGKDGCGIPWNWSRSIKGNSLCCMAGGIRKNGVATVSHSRSHRSHGQSSMVRGAGKFCSSSTTSTEATTEFSQSSINSDSDSFPLLDYGESSSNSEEGVHSLLQQQGFHSRRHGHGKCTSQSMSDKYAPQSFDEIVGQGLITQALCSAMSRGRIAAMYIFSGPRGVGKTTCARVLAMALNCSSEESRRPCGSCSECRMQRRGPSSSRRAEAFMEVSASVLEGSKGSMRKLARKTTRPWPWPSKYRVVAIKECDMLSSQSWDGILKVVGNATRNHVFIFCTSGGSSSSSGSTAAAMEKLPNAVISGCQKFVFSKIKDMDMVCRLRGIAEQEGLQVEDEALKLIVCASNGSLRDAVTMFDQLSLLGHRISVAMAQELMGIVPDCLLVDLLDFALSADTVNTVQNLKELITSGVDPSNLMSQLACLITSILAGGYQIPKGRHRRKFFRKNELSKEDMERLRQALRTLCEAEKQLRGCSDQTTWLTAALLQFAPDQSYLLPSPSYDTSCTASSRCLNTVNTTPDMNSSKPRQAETPHARSGSRSESVPKWMSDLSNGPVGNHQDKSMVVKKGRNVMTNKSELEEVWQRILDAVHSNNLRKFLQLYGKLVSLSLQKGFALAVLQFCQSESVSRAERSKASIAHAFQVALGCPADVKMQIDVSAEGQKRWKKKMQTLPGDQSSISGSPLGETNENHGNARSYGLHYGIYQSHVSPEDPSKPMNPFETTDMAALDRPDDAVVANDDENNTTEKKLENAWLQGASTTNLSSSDTVGVHDRLTCKTVGFTTQQDESLVEDSTNAMARQGCSSRHRGVKWINFMCNSNNTVDCGTDQQLENQNLCLESRSTSLLQCCHGELEKEDQLEKTTTRPRFLWRLCSCMNLKHK